MESFVSLNLTNNIIKKLVNNCPLSSTVCSLITLYPRFSKNGFAVMEAWVVIFCIPVSKTWFSNSSAILVAIPFPWWLCFCHNFSIPVTIRISVYNNSFWKDTCKRIKISMTCYAHWCWKECFIRLEVSKIVNMSGKPVK